MPVVSALQAFLFYPPVTQLSGWHPQGALEGRLEGNEMQIEQSGLLQFEQELKAFLAAERGQIKLLRFSAFLKASLKVARESLSSMREVMRSELDDIQSRRAEISQALARVESEIRQVSAQQDASDSIQRLVLACGAKRS